MRAGASLRIGPALRFGWSSFRRRPGLFVAIFGTLLLSWAVLEVLVVALQRLGPLVNITLHLLFLAFFSGLKLGFLRLALAAYDGSRPRYRDLFSRLASGPRFLAAGLLYLGAILLGLVLLLLPGIYLGLRLAPFGFLIAELDSAVGASFRAASELTRGSIPALLGFAATLLALNLAGAALLGVGLIVTVPVSVLSAAALYRQLETR